MDTPDSGFVEIPGVRLAYDIAGHGPPVIFLHGGLLDRRMWDDQFSFFANRRQAIRYDMRSAGQSETRPSTDPYTHHEDLYQFIRVLKLERVSLVGHSNHGVALDFAIAYPNLVDKLVLVSPGLRGYDFRDPWIGAGFGDMVGALQQRDLSRAVEVFLTMWVDGPYRTPAEVDRAVRERVGQMVAGGFRASRNAPNSVGLDLPAAGRLFEVQTPTFVILGAKDAPDIHSIGQLVHESVAGSKLVQVPDVGHTLVMEKPGELNDLIEDFLRI